jgi:hypothetical protein
MARSPLDGPPLDGYDSGLLVGPADEVTANALAMDVDDDEVGDLLIALLGWDQAVQSLCASRDLRAGRVLLSCTSWLLLG